MKSPLLLSAVAFLCLLTASTGYAQEDAKDGKAIPVQQESKPVSQDEWQFSVTPCTFLPSVDLQLSLPTVTIGNRTIGGDISVSQPLWKTISKFGDNFYFYPSAAASRPGKDAGADSSTAIGFSEKNMSAAVIPGSYSATESISQQPRA